MKIRVKVYPVQVMGEVNVDAPSEAKAIEIAEAAALVGKLKFFSPDRRFVSLIYKEGAKLRTKAPPEKSSKPEGELLEGGHDDGT